MNTYDLYFPSFRLDSNYPPLNEWQRIFQSKERRKANKKEVIIDQGQDVKFLYYIVSGLVEYTFTCPDGTQEMLEILGAGNIFGLQPIFGKNPAIGSFIALEDSVLARMSVEELNHQMDMNPVLVKELLVELSKITGGLIRQIYEQTFCAEHRVEQAIYLLADYKSKASPTNQKISISLSQDDLARITRTTRVTVTKVLAELKRQEFIGTAYGEILVKDLNALRSKLLAIR